MAIWHIGKAQAEIKRLTAENEAFKKQVADMESATAENSSEAVKAAEGLQASLDAANSKIATLEAEVKTTQASLLQMQNAAKDLTAQLAAKDKEVEVKVSQKLASTQAQLGQQPPVPPEPEKCKKSNKTGRARTLEAARVELQKMGYAPKN